MLITSPDQQKAADYALAHIVGRADIMRTRLECGRDITDYMVDNLEADIRTLRRFAVVETRFDGPRAKS